MISHLRDYGKERLKKEEDKMEIFNIEDYKKLRKINKDNGLNPVILELKWSRDKKYNLENKSLFYGEDIWNDG